MKRLGPLACVLLLVLTLWGLSAQSASAVLPEIGRCVEVVPGSGEYEVASCTGGAKVSGGNHDWLPSTEQGEGEFAGYAVSGGETKFETTGGFKIVCKSVAGEGLFSLPREVKPVPILNQCEEPVAKATCRNLGPNTIQAPFEGDLGFIKNGVTVSIGADLRPTSLFGVITCLTGNSQEESKFEASVIPRVAPIDHMTATFTLTFREKEGKQKVTHLEGLPFDTPVLFFPKIPFAEQAGLESVIKLKIAGGQKLEIKAKP
jgi:hypothetical protein